LALAHTFWHLSTVAETYTLTTALLRGSVGVWFCFRGRGVVAMRGG